MFQIRHLYVSAGHSFFGRHGLAPDPHPMEERERVHCLAGRGIEGDRFLDYKDDYKGQITFFAEEVYDDLSRLFDSPGHPPSVFRRNIITAGIDLNALIGEDFTIQGVRFRGTAECAPCHWMDQAFHPGAEAALKGRGGLRAKILNDGWIAKGPAGAQTRPPHLDRA